MAINTKLFLEKHLKIKDKQSEIVPLMLNKAQLKLYEAIKAQHSEGKPVRAIILKARQMGFSTLVEGIIFKETATQANINSGVVTHEISATNNLFRMSKRFYDELDDDFKPSLKANNAKILEFDFASGNSAIKCMTAGNTSIGRSDTFQNLHISEYAYWAGEKKETLTGLLQAVPNHKDTMVIIESTANGYDDFKDMWDKAVSGENDFIPVFCAWQEHKEYTLAYNGFELTEEETRLKEIYSLTNEQLTWRRWCIKNNCGGNTDLFKQEYPSCAQEAFLMSGLPVFDNVKVIQRMEQLRGMQFKTGAFVYGWNNPETKDRITSYEFAHGEYIRIYEESKEGVPYVIGADTKGEGKDFYGATVIDNTTGRRVATLHMQVSESKPFTYQLYCLGKYYNDALIGVEINFNTAPVEELSRLDYPKQYVRRRYDDFTKAMQTKFGFKTDGNTRPLIIDKEIDIINNNTELFYDIPTLQEAITFVYKNGRPDAIEGKHDDLLFSDMIANEIRGQQSFDVQKTSQEKVKWRADWWEDYNNASEEEKEYLIKMRGNPF